MAAKHLMRATIAALLATVITGAGAVILLLAVHSGSSAPLSYRTLDYNVTVNPDGSMRIVETIDMHLRERENDDGDTVPWRQFYQRYTLRSTDVTDITDISVKNVSTGETYSQGDAVDATDVSMDDWSTYEKQWYIGTVSFAGLLPFDSDIDGLDVDANNEEDFEYSFDATEVEIGWNIPPVEDARSMIFQVSMTWKNVVTDYKDVAKLQWEPISDSNTIPIGTLTASVQLPDGATTDNSQAWLHYTGTSSVSRADDGRTLKFTASDIRPNEYLDLVTIYDVNLSHAARYVDSNIKQGTIKSETAQETRWREEQRKKARIQVLIWVAIGLVGIGCAVWTIWGAIKSRRDTTYHGDIEYWREPLDMSPAAAARMDMVLHGKTSTESNMLRNRQLSATLMSLVSKGAIAVCPGSAIMYSGIDPTNPAAILARSRELAANPDNERILHRTTTIVLLPAALAPDLSPLCLSASEAAELDLLLQVSQRLNCAIFDMEQMKDALHDWEEGILYLNTFIGACAKEVKQLHALRSAGLMYGLPSVILLCISVASLVYFSNMPGQWALTLLFSLPCSFIGIFALFYGSSTSLTTPQGQQIAGRVLGLRRYLEDFSSFTDRGSADLPMWGRYLVYATAFGISRKALREFAAANVWADDDDLWTGNMMGVMLYWSMFPPGHYSPTSAATAHMSPTSGADVSAFAGSFDFGDMFTSSMNSIASTIEAAAPQSSGSGGSFSSGGGFGGGGGGAGGGSFGGR